MKRKLLVILTIVLSLSIFFYACEKDETDPIEQEDDNEEEEEEEEETLSLTEILEKEYNALGDAPIDWSDEELVFLDAYANKKIVGLGEATHGTSEFFEAKHRIFRYLVENHGFKIFVMEADFGESLYINEIVQSGDVAAVRDYMDDYMHFWTWKTREVKALIEWMCEYNIGKSDEEKVHYMGHDCQFNTYHPDLAKDYLVETSASFMTYAVPILNEAKAAYNDNFSTFTSFQFENEFMPKLNALLDTIANHKEDLIAESSEKEYELFVRTVKLVKQVSEVRYNSNVNPYVNIRDLYMAENTAWMLDYFDGEKIVTWAHNAHVANYFDYGSMGYYLTNQYADDYAIIGFQFAKGSFRAVTYENGEYTGLDIHVIDTIPVSNSLNAHFTEAEASTFCVKVADLQSYPTWDSVFNTEITYISIGAVFDGYTTGYYYPYNTDFWDEIIYMDTTTTAIGLLK